MLVAQAKRKNRLFDTVEQLQTAQSNVAALQVTEGFLAQEEQPEEVEMRERGSGRGQRQHMRSSRSR